MGNDYRSALATSPDAVGLTEVDELLSKAREQPPRVALALAGEAVLRQLESALVEGKVRFRNRQIGDAKKALTYLRRSGLHFLLIEGFSEGQLSYAAVSRHLDRLGRWVRDRKRTAQEIKLGILAFDEVAQRLAIAGGVGGPFRYPLRDRARDSLITFARALHR